jgi:hypothetical protein
MGVTMKSVQFSIIIATDREEFRNFDGSLNGSSIEARLKQEFDLSTFNKDHYKNLKKVERQIKDSEGNVIGATFLEIDET